MRMFERQPLSPEALWCLEQSDHEVRCEIGDSTEGPEMRLFYDGRKLLCYQGANRRSLLEVAWAERDDLEARGWRPSLDVV